MLDISRESIIQTYHTDVTESLVGVLVAIVYCEAVVGFCAVVVCQLDDTFAITPMGSWRSRLGSVISCHIVRSPLSNVIAGRYLGSTGRTCYRETRVF